jgi:glycosyltransferase involved in cell wall biosynthesis
LEAFACGKPVIGSRIGGIPELVKDYETGLLFEPGDSRDLSYKIQYLSTNTQKAQEMGRRGRDFVRHELSAEKHYGRLMDIYNSLMKRISSKFC